MIKNITNNIYFTTDLKLMRYSSQILDSNLLNVLVLSDQHMEFIQVK
jgi:hypothetical protein